MPVGSCNYLFYYHSNNNIVIIFISTYSKKLRSEKGLYFGNDIYRIEFEQKENFPEFGASYLFTLKDAVQNLPEYLVHIATLQR